ncbi:hypothetical protein MUN84_18705 [Hymenobacter sp. 5516J-16]|uniref:DUF7017 domain-containing protein n=1 Tax=Hymenobacter sp. 5516J-16 TaxID=2932253 RepID=UPI001FD17077|nr:hypothetical protein [Hymenobacter sp. 5516J-16]UOQ76545.1 hypothetical protein MUN84_18705 [Hymenobacter sp. 5516J-16]
MAAVSELCRTGQLKQAYQLAEENYRLRPESVFNQIDIHQVLLAYFRQAVAGVDGRAAGRCLQKLADLSLVPCVSREESVFWELRRLLADLASRQPVPGAIITELLRSMLQWQTELVPSRGRSVLLQAALKVKDYLPDGWLAWWNLNLLRAEDFVQDTITDKASGKARKLPSNAERAYGAWANQLAESLQKSRTGDAAHRALVGGQVPHWRREAEALLLLLEVVTTEHPEYQWLPYQRAKLLVALGDDLTAALQALMPVVRQKSTDYWAWQLLGEVLRPTNEAATLACYYRAANCRTEEHFLGKVREALFYLLRDAGFQAEAAHQLRLLVAHKDAEGYHVPAILRQQLAEPWCVTAGQPNKKQHFRWLEQADELLYGDLLWQPAVLLDIIEATDEKPAAARVLLMPDTPPVRVPLKRYAWLSKRQLGHPLQVRLQAEAGRNRILQLTDRPIGQPWDVVPARCAVVTYTNAAKQTAGFVLSPQEQGTFKYPQHNLPEPVPGDSLEVRLRHRTNKEGQPRVDVLSVLATQQNPPASVSRCATGSLRVLDGGFGFLEQIFVPPGLIRAHGWETGQTVSLQAVWNHDNKKNKSGWVAVRALIS